MIADHIVHRDPRSIIVLPGRQRQRDITIDDLIPSIRARGILHPILVDDDLQLVTGERRLRTAIHLELATVPTRLYSTLDQAELKLIELEENLRRQDLAWQDKALAFLELHLLYGANKEVWETEQTAGIIGYDRVYTEKMVRLGEAIKSGDQVISNADTVGAALTILTRRRDREGAAIIASILEVEREVSPVDDGEVVDIEEVIADQLIPHEPGTPSPVPVVVKKAAPPDPPFCIHNLDFAQWATEYEGPKFNFLHCDFPYGVILNQLARQDRNEGAYDGGEEIYWTLMKVLAHNLERLLLPSAHVMFWISMKHYTHTMSLLTGPMGFAMNPTPLVWHKTDNKGIIADPLRGGRNTYEACLFGSLGDRKIVKPVSNSYGAPTGKADAIHTNEKPEPMLNHFFSMFVDEHTRLLDPTCGGGSSIRSAEALGAERALGLELDPEFAQRAQGALASARGLRKLSSRTSGAT